jgi:undecaprenyl-diphosphatase
LNLTAVEQHFRDSVAELWPAGDVFGHGEAQGVLDRARSALYDLPMSQGVGEPQQTVGDALAQAVAARPGVPSVLAKPLEELGAVDRAVYQAVAATPTPELDGHYRRLSRAADHSVLWLGIAAAIAVVGGRNGRRAAVEGVLAIGATSATVNLGIKPLARRRRPARADPAQFEARVVPMPESDSFPSGHAASAFAFAYAVGRHMPGLAVPIRLLAGGVAYSRVHTGVHYPGDVAIGAIVGSGIAAMVGAACDQAFQRARGDA